MPGPVHAKLLTRARATSTYLAAGVLVGTVTAVLVVIQARLLSSQIAAVFTTHRVDGLERTVALLVAVLAGRALLRSVNPWLGRRAAAVVKGQLRRDVLAARLNRPVDPRADTGSLVTLVTAGLDALDGYYAKYLPQLMLAVTVPLVVGVAILTSDLLTTLIVVLTVPLIPFFMALIGWATERRMARRWAVQSRLAHHFADLVAGLPTLQVFGRARAQAIGLQHIEARNRDETMATLRISFLSALALELLSTLSVAVVAVSIGLRVVEGGMDLSTALYLLILAPEVYLPLRQVGAHYHDSAEGIAAADQAFAEIDEPAVGDGGAAAPTGGSIAAPDPARVPIRLSGVSVTYRGAERPALPPTDLEVRPGEMTALAGPSGAGKSTLLAVLLGFVGPSAGTVEVGGTPLVGIDPTRWRERIAWVAQNPRLLTGTVATNVALGAPGVSDAVLREALDRVGGAGIDLRHRIGPDADGLSDGERRRVGLARALVRLDHGASLLLLDEPTAGLDTGTEATVLAALRGSGVTMLVVSHRPAVLAAADRVVYVGSTVPA